MNDLLTTQSETQHVANPAAQVGQNTQRATATRGMLSMKTISNLRLSTKKVLLVVLVGIVALGLFTLIPSNAPAVQAQNGNTWTVNYWPNPDWQGYSPFVQQVGILAFNWGTGAPMPGMPSDNFTARATTSAWFNAGTYQFSTQADDEVTLVINGVTYVNTINQGQSGKTQFVTVTLPDGWANLRVDYREFTGNAYLFVNWVWVSGAQPTPTPVPGNPTPTPTPVPGNNPAPGTVVLPSATSVQTQFGDYTPCIQQRIHQVNCFVPNGAWNSPNAGSIQMEPQILIWGNCTADSVQNMQIYVNTPPQSAACSKTEAGWFPR
jgi:hypothetical protein